MVAHLGIVYARLGDDVLKPKCRLIPYYQPFGLLHGGASAALAERWDRWPDL